MPSRNTNPMTKINNFINDFDDVFAYNKEACRNRKNFVLCSLKIPTQADLVTTVAKSDNAEDCQTRSIVKECLDFVGTTRRNMVSRRKVWVDFSVANARRCEGVRFNLEKKRSLIGRLDQ